MELASGCVAIVPIKGTAISCAIDLGILTYDVMEAMGDDLDSDFEDSLDPYLY